MKTLSKLSVATAGEKVSTCLVIKINTIYDCVRVEILLPEEEDECRRKRWYGFCFHSEKLTT